MILSLEDREGEHTNGQRDNVTPKAPDGVELHLKVYLGALAWLESGTMVMGALLRPTLNPAGLHSTNWIVLCVLMFWMALFTS